MQDIIYISVMVAFFGVCVAYVRGLDHLVSSSEADEVAADLVDPDNQPTSQSTSAGSSAAESIDASSTESMTGAARS